MSYLCLSYRSIAAAAIVILPASLFAATWLPATGDYGVAANWDTAAVPVAGESAYILNGGTATLGDGLTYGVANLYLNTINTPQTIGSRLDLSSGTLSVSTYVRTGYGSILSVQGGTLGLANMIVGQSTSGVPTDESFLNVSSGSVTLTGSLLVGRTTNGTLNITGGSISGGSIFPGAGSNVFGTVNHSGGTVTSRIRMGENSSADWGPGVYNLSGTGVLTSSTRLTIGHQANGTFNLLGGTLNAPGAATQIGALGGNGVLAVSGGTASLTAGAELGSLTNLNGSGTIRMTGTGGSLTISGGSALKAYDKSTLNFEIGATGVSPIVINVSNPVASGTGTLLAGVLDIDMLGDFVPTVGQTYDLISNGSNYTGTTTSGTYTNGYDLTSFELAAEDQPYWTYALVNEGGRNILRATNTAPIPEPATVGLLSVVAMAMLARRHRKA